jgi:hypothetical protein
MKETEINLPGFTTELHPDDRPSIGVFGPEGVGKTHFGITMPTPIGVIALDKKCKRTTEAVAQELGILGKVYVNKKPIVSDLDCIRMAMMEDDTVEQSKEVEEETKGFYRGVMNRVYDFGGNLAKTEAIQSVLVDTGSQLWQWILFKHFGRTTKIMPRDRGWANQDMIDFFSMFRGKNLCVLHRAKERWKKTGKVVKGEPEMAPSGEMEPDGFRHMGTQLTANLELYAERNKMGTDKFRCRVLKCQTNPEVEGKELGEYGVEGEDVTWDNVMVVLGIE